MLGLRMLVSGFEGDEAVARPRRLTGREIVLRRQRPRARPGFARATGRRLVFTRP